jgi:hypothetical protein
MKENFKSGNEHKLFSTFVKWSSLQGHKFKKIFNHMSGTRQNEDY